MFAPVSGFITFLLLLPAREEQLDIDYVDGRGESVHHCYTHLGWQDVLGPLSCSRGAAALAGLLVGLVVAELGRRARERGHSRRSAGH